MDCQKTRCFTLFVFTLCISVLCGCASGGGHGPVGKIKDEALSATPPRLPDSFGFADEDWSVEHALANKTEARQRLDFKLNFRVLSRNWCMALNSLSAVPARARL